MSLWMIFHKRVHVAILNQFMNQMKRKKYIMQVYTQKMMISMKMLYDNYASAYRNIIDSQDENSKCVINDS